MSPFKVSVGGGKGSPAPSNTVLLVSQLMHNGPSFFFFFSECRLSLASDTEVVLNWGGGSFLVSSEQACWYFDDWTLLGGMWEEELSCVCLLMRFSM